MCKVPNLNCVENGVFFFLALATVSKCQGATALPPTAHIPDANVGLRASPRDPILAPFRRERCIVAGVKKANKSSDPRKFLRRVCKDVFKAELTHKCQGHAIDAMAEMHR